MKATFSAGQRLQITGIGDFFRLLATVGAVTVEFYYQGREIAERVDIEAGFAEQFKNVQFDRVDITSATVQAVQWETALGSEIRYDRGAATISGTVGLDSATLRGAFTQAQATVTNASTSLAAAKANRRYLLIQNNDSSGAIFVTLNEVAATLLNGIKIEPLGSYEIQGFAPTGQIFAIGSIASNANCVIVEG